MKPGAEAVLRSPMGTGQVNRFNLAAALRFAGLALSVCVWRGFFLRDLDSDPMD